MAVINNDPIKGIDMSDENKLYLSLHELVH